MLTSRVRVARAPVRCLIAGFATLAALTAWMHSADFRVWVANDSVRIDPVGGKAFEDQPLLFPDTLTGGYQSSSQVWDAERALISLKAARNEIVAFQIIVERLDDDPLLGVNVEISDLEGPGRITLPSGNLELLKEWYVQVKRPSSQDYTLGTGWYPDALLPGLQWTGNLYPSTYILPFDIPDRLNNLGRRQRNHALWVDLYVPRERAAAPPGIYRSTIDVTSQAGTRRMNLELEVWDFELPEVSHLAGNIHTDTEINDLPEVLELKYYQLIRRHRLAMGVLGYAPDIRIEQTEVHFDWTDYDRRLGKYLDGTAFTQQHGYQGPGYGVPVELLILPFDSHPMNEYKTLRGIQVAGKEFKFYRAWPVDLPREGITQEYESIFRSAFQGFQRHFEEHPEWTTTRPIVFFLGLDEAYDEKSYETMIFYARLLEESGAERLEFRIDGLYPLEAMQRLSQYVDIAILAPGGFDPDRVGDLRRNGIEDWFYTGAATMDGDLLGCRALSWVCWRYGISSWTLWELDFNALRAYLYPETYVTGDRVYNGHGMLIYRGETMGLKEPVPSIRLKQLRRGAQDYEYFWLAAQQPGQRQAVDEAVAGIVYQAMGTSATWGSPGMWNHNPEKWESVRIAVGEQLHRAAGATR